MSERHSLISSMVGTGLGAVADNEYWLTIEQILDDDRATAADVAGLVDELYDLDPCFDPATEGMETAPDDSEPTKDDLLDAAVSKLDLEECARRKSGTYIAELKIVRSHPDIPYTLRLDVGEIKQTVIVEEAVSVSLPVELQSSIILPYPVRSGLVASWQGTVYSKQGTVTPPVISARGNVLFWAGEVTGTIRAEFATIYEMVTVEVPGIPNYEGSPLGEPQDANILAFYHYQVYQATITAPPEDTGADAATLAEICGWNDDEQLDQPPEDEPLPEEPEPPEYGCIEYSQRFGDPNYYAEKCCTSNAAPNPCAVRTEPNPGGNTLPQETIDRLTREHDGPIEFIAVGPDGPDGCGKFYYRQTVKPKNCCDEVEPLYFDDDQTADVLPAGGSIYLFASGGIPPYTFTTSSNATSFPDGRKTWTTDYPVALLEAGPTFCGLTAVSVTDGCTTDTVEIRSDLGSWYPIGNSCVLPGASATYTSPGGVDYWRAEAIAGRYKVVESQEWQLWNGMQGGMPFGCSETSEGSCSSGYRCEPCESGYDAHRNAFMLSCLPSSSIGWPCLAARSDAAVRGEINATSWPIVADLVNSGQQWVWLSDYGISYGVCGASVSHWWNLGWIEKGPSEPEAWEWKC